MIICWLQIQRPKFTPPRERGHDGWLDNRHDRRLSRFAGYDTKPSTPTRHPTDQIDANGFVVVTIIMRSEVVVNGVDLAEQMSLEKLGLEA